MALYESARALNRSSSAHACRPAALRPRTCVRRGRGRHGWRMRPDAPAAALGRRAAGRGTPPRARGFFAARWRSTRGIVRPGAIWRQRTGCSAADGDVQRWAMREGRRAVDSDRAVGPPSQVWNVSSCARGERFCDEWVRCCSRILARVARLSKVDRAEPLLSSHEAPALWFPAAPDPAGSEPHGSVDHRVVADGVAREASNQYQRPRRRRRTPLTGPFPCC